MFSRSISLGVFTIGLTLAAPALAQDPLEPSNTEGKRAEGKARYERGVEAYSAGRFKDAIDLFLQADALAPSAALSFNIARAYEKIGDDAACLQWYRDFRRRAPDAKNAREVDQRIVKLQAALAKKGVQQYSVFSSPLGATVIVDDQPVGVTPFTGQVAPGRHKVVLSLRGYADSEQKLELAADRAQDLDVPLVPKPDKPVEVEAPPPPPPPVVVKPRPVEPHDNGARFGPWPWIGLGVGAAALGGSLGFELARRSSEHKAEDADSQLAYKEQLDHQQTRQTTARVLAAVGGALVVTGGTLLVIDLTSRKDSTTRDAQLGAACLPGGCAFDVRGRF
ncbi:MAG TPA: PEGA domain-containing protein [Polyangiaceae bacterium]|nr:PEGA domain-containing protein [Polyangiaceae bacterium]